MKKSSSATNTSMSFRFGDQSTLMESMVIDSARNVFHMDDALNGAIYVQNAYEHIQQIRDCILASRQKLKLLRQTISDLKLSIKNFETHSLKELTDVEYSMQQKILTLRQQFIQNSLTQNGLNTIFEDQIGRLVVDDEELHIEAAALEQQIEKITPELGQYTFIDLQ